MINLPAWLAGGLIAFVLLDLSLPLATFLIVPLFILAAGAGALVIWQSLRARNLRIELEAAQEQIQALQKRQTRKYPYRKSGGKTRKRK